MAPYNHRVNTHHRQERANKTKKFSKILLLFIFFGAGIVVFDWISGLLRPNDTAVSSSSSATVQSAKINIFQTPDFRFQTDESWREVTDEFSNPKGEYLYRSYKNGLIEQELWVTSNTDKDYTIDNYYPNRIIPVSIGSDGRFKQLGGVSGRCIEALPKGDTNENPRVLTQNDITYHCHPNSTNFIITVGEVDGTNKIKFTKENGETTTLTMIYKNVKSHPDARQFERIISTFQIQ